MDPGEGLVQRRRRRLLLLLFASSARAQIAHGPVRSAHADHLDAGWVSDHYPLSDGQQFGVTDVHSGGSVHVQGDSRLYFIQDYKAEGWTEHQYTRIDLRQEPLVFTLDLSHVPCGCLACVYMVAMKDPSGSSNNYCDMAENLAPGWEDDTCIEIDILEANNHAMQTAIHTETGKKWASGNCDQNGCFARTGGPRAPDATKNLYGSGKTIDTQRPFQVKTSMDHTGEMTIVLSQNGRSVTTFDHQMAGNPQGHGVPESAKPALVGAQGHLALVASLWTANDMSWLDDKCRTCTLDDAFYTISGLKIKSRHVPFPPFPMLPPAPPPMIFNGHALFARGLSTGPDAAIMSSTVGMMHPGHYAVDGDLSTDCATKSEVGAWLSVKLSSATQLVGFVAIYKRHSLDTSISPIERNQERQMISRARIRGKGGKKDKAASRERRKAKEGGYVKAPKDADFLASESWEELEGGEITTL